MDQVVETDSHEFLTVGWDHYCKINNTRDDKEGGFSLTFSTFLSFFLRSSYTVNKAS